MKICEIVDTTLTELSTDLLARYKTKAGQSARDADAAGNYKKGDSRFKGINNATHRQFANDRKKHVKIDELADEVDVISRVASHTGLPASYLKGVWDKIYNAAIAMYGSENSPGFDSFVKQHFLHKALSKLKADGASNAVLESVQKLLAE